MTVAAIILAHPAVALVFVPTYAIVVVTHAALTFDRQHFLRLLRCFGVAWATGLAVSAPYWQAVWTMEQWVDMSKLTLGYYTASKHVVDIGQFFSNTWGFGVSREGPGDGMSFQLGAPHFLLSLAGLALGWRRPVVRAAFGMYLGLILVMSIACRWLWDLPITPLQKIQFPWRLLAVTAAWQVLCIAAVGALWKRPWVWAALCVAAILWYQPQFSLPPKTIVLSHELLRRRSGDLSQFWKHANTDEFMPRTAKGTPLEKPRLEAPLLVLADPQARDRADRSQCLAFTLPARESGANTRYCQPVVLSGLARAHQPATGRANGVGKQYGQRRSHPGSVARRHR